MPVLEINTSIVQNQLPDRRVEPEEASVSIEAGTSLQTSEGDVVTWFRRAADQGDAWAQLELGNLYNEGHGVEQDDHEAIKWRLRAAEQGNQFVARNLGGHYAGGYGIEKDNIQAYKWFSIAAMNGDEDSQKYKQRLEEEMTPIQVAESQKLAREWVEKHQKK